VQIGCLRKKLAVWLRHYKDIGQEQNYTEAEITEYHAHLLHIQRSLEIEKTKEIS